MSAAKKYKVVTFTDTDAATEKSATIFGNTDVIAKRALTLFGKFGLTAEDINAPSEAKRILGETPSGKFKYEIEVEASAADKLAASGAANLLSVEAPAVIATITEAKYDQAIKQDVALNRRLAPVATAATKYKTLVLNDTCPIMAGIAEITGDPTIGAIQAMKRLHNDYGLEVEHFNPAVPSRFLGQNAEGKFVYTMEIEAGMADKLAASGSKYVGAVLEAGQKPKAPANNKGYGF